MNKHKGFTLVELIVVIAILAILSVALIPLVNNLIDKSRISRLLSDVAAIKSAATAYNADVGSFNALLSNIALGKTRFDVSDLGTNNNNLSTWSGPYIELNFIHPWNGVYVLDDADIDGTGPKDLSVVLTAVDSSGQSVVIPTQFVIDEVNKKTTGTTTPDKPRAGKAADLDPGALNVVVLSDIE